MTGIFVSYRRADAQGWAGRLSADLAAAFGDVARFFDLNSIPPGADFRLEIERSLAAAAGVLVLIGPRWLDLRGDDGVRRLEDPDDVVAAEVEQALALPVPVLPVLLGGATMPPAAALPERLRPLARRNAIELSDSRWEHDRDRLFAALETATPLTRRVAPPAAASIRVGSGLELVESEVGNVTGVRGGAPPQAVDVLNDARIKNSKVGDITGVDLGPPGRPK